jgi:NADH:ubiquinone oxidoreductase subunit K
MNITLAHYLVLGAILFAASVVGIFLNRKNVIVLLMAIELDATCGQYELYRFLTLFG